jgi:hypothetical protein
VGVVSSYSVFNSAKSKWGGNEAAGELHLIFEFAGPPGVAYPQHQPTMDSFDDSQRKNKSGVERAEKEKKDREDAAEAARKAAEDVGGIPQGARERLVAILSFFFCL